MHDFFQPLSPFFTDGQFPNNCPGFEEQLLAPLGQQQPDLLLEAVHSPMVDGGRRPGATQQDIKREPDHH